MQLADTLPMQESIRALRLKYLDYLSHFQDIYLEFMVPGSVGYILKEDEQTAGYALITPEKVLIEFYLQEQFHDAVGSFLRMVVLELDVRSVYVKSFDTLLTSCCQEFPSKEIGILYRDYFDTEIAEKTEMSVRWADSYDLPLLLEYDDEVFEPKELLPEYIQEKSILLCYWQNRYVGCGFLTCVHPGWKYYDIGVWVHPDLRRQGIGTRIIAWLKLYCIASGGEPICGCGIDNIGSRMVLERNGFSGRHRLIEYSIKPGL